MALSQTHVRSFTKLDPTFHDLVVFRRAAERAYEQFRKGDRFVAEGHVRTYDHHVDGQPDHRDEFVARRIGHDSARTTYTIDRTPRPDAPAQDLDERPAAATPATGSQRPAPPPQRPAAARHTPPMSR